MIRPEEATGVRRWSGWASLSVGGRDAAVRRPALAALCLWCLLPVAVTHAAADGEVAQVAEGMRKSRQQLLQLPGGLSFNFRVDAEQHRERPYFLFPDGLDGSFAVKWPQIHDVAKGKMVGITRFIGNRQEKISQDVLHEGSYNFQTKTDVSRDGSSLGQISGTRHVFSSQYVFPFTFQYFVEFSQQYFPGEVLETSFWLPNALEQHAYEMAGEETIEGVPCRVLRRPNVDTLWIADRHGYTLLKRELHYGVGKPVQERMWSHDLRQISPGVWIPMRITHEVYDLESPDKRLVRHTVQISNLEVGNVDDAQLAVVFPEDIGTVEDFVTGTISQRFAKPGEQDEETVLTEAAKGAQFLASGDKRRNPWMPAIVLGNIAAMLGVVWIVLHRRLA